LPCRCAGFIVKCLNSNSVVRPVASQGVYLHSAFTSNPDLLWGLSTQPSHRENLLVPCMV